MVESNDAQNVAANNQICKPQLERKIVTSRQRILTVLDGGVPDRVPLHDTYWETTIDRWRSEGLPKGSAAEEFFGTDEIVFLQGDYSMQFPERVIEQADSLRTYWDSNGALRKDLRTHEGWTSQWLDFTIKTRDDWSKHRHKMSFDRSRIAETTLSKFERARSRGQFVCYSAHACFHPTWERIGMETELILMLEQPDFIHDMYAAHVQLVIDIFDELIKLGVEFDGARLADDLGYHTAPLISPKLYHDLVLPNHKKLCDHFSNYGLKTILHSDGNIAPLIDHFLEAGITGLHPLEAKAGLDARSIKARYGKDLVLFGNIDVRKLAGTREDIEEEIVTKVPAAKKNGGYIYHSDHSVPNNVSLDNYKFAIELVKKYGSYD